jgi:hypothetical protein
MPAKKSEDNSSKEFEAIKLLYERASNDWRHYDSHVWQIPSVALTVNAFFISQAFNKDLIKLGGYYSIIRAIIIFIACLFTLVLAIALSKHRLNQQGKAKNLEIFEEMLGVHTRIFKFEKTEELKEVEENPTFPEILMARLKAHNWLIGVMVLTLVLDIVIFFGIIFSCW